MDAVIAIFLPSIIGVVLYKIITKEENILNLILNYLFQVVVFNVMMWIVLEIRNHGITNFSEYIANDFSFALKYMSTIMGLSLVFGIVFAVLKKYFTFEVIVENGRKKKKK